MAGHVDSEVGMMSQTEQLMSIPAQFRDIATGELIPNDRCLYNCKELDRIQKLFQEGRELYKTVKRDTPGSKEEKKAAAKKASEEHAGGGYTQIWNRLCRDKICISLVATGPPAKDTEEAKDNEQRLLMALYQCDPSLTGWHQDHWTSVKEIGTLHQTSIYVRYPYHMGEKLHKVCQVLSTATIDDTHKFTARVITEGRAKLHHPPAEVKPWQLQINGQQLAALDAEDIAAATTMKPSLEDSFMKVMPQPTYHLSYQKSIAGENQCAAESIWPADWQHIKDSRAYLYSQMLAKNDDLQTCQAYFQISGLVISAANQGNNQPGPMLSFYTCKHAALFGEGQELFLSTRVGDTMLALDEPFKLSFDEGSAGNFLDADGTGIWAVYGLKYEVDEHKSIVLK